MKRPAEPAQEQRGPLPARFTPPPGYAPRTPLVLDCTACGACCAAPDIHALSKPLGVPCRFLQVSEAACLCQIYAERPGICRRYQPDWVCGEVAPLPTLEARVRRFLEIYGLDEAQEENGIGQPRGGRLQTPPQ
ncbi:YkgJ family cysteine cluster protein [Deinococcus lacus]|uniref:YkgJ family cysteine cluster protein n=1 Tax=Deinococcus lacus TaxID=392561 RepID=A0ABW1YFK1_9DEIO